MTAVDDLIVDINRNRFAMNPGAVQAIVASVDTFTAALAFLAIALPSAAAQNSVYAGPVGGAGVPAFRAVVNADLPAALNPTSIQFGSSTALSDYEEGTWTPTVMGSTVAGTPTYVAQEGYYTKIGREVILSFTEQITALGGATGNLQLGGAPFPMGTSTSNAAKGGGVLSLIIGLTHAAGYTAWVLKSLGSGTTAIGVQENGSNVASVAQTIANTAAATTLAGLFTYFT